MPCQEHGVLLFGFHEERIDEDAFADGSAADRRDRRASPSGESEKTKCSSHGYAKNEQKEQEMGPYKMARPCHLNYENGLEVKTKKWG